MTIRFLVAVLSLAAQTLAQDQPPEEIPLAERAYIGLTLRDTPDGTVVAWVLPGPLGGTGFDSASGLRRGDNIDAVNGEPLDAAAFTARISSMSPGDAVSIAARRSPESDPAGAVPKGGPGGEPFTIELTLGNQDEWTGTLRRGLRDGAALPEPDEGEFESMLLGLAAEAGIRDAAGGLDALLPYLAGVQTSQLDTNSLPAIVNAFRRPLSVDAVERPVFERAKAAAGGGYAAAASLIAHVLDVPDPGSLEEMDTHRYVMRAYFNQEQGFSDQEDLDWWADAERLVLRLRDSVYIYDDRAADHIRAVRMGGRYAEGRIMTDVRALLRPSPHLMLLYNNFGRDPVLPEDRVPPAVREAVKGEIIGFSIEEDGALRILGGPGPNEYDMSKVADVYDLGGDDVYRFAPAPDRRNPATVGRNHVIIDEGGDDQYLAEHDFCGPGVGYFGLSLIDDRGGNDLYRSSARFSIGAGLFGIGIIIDRAGDDRYENLGPGSGWSLGAGFYGAGLILDLGGHDTYLGEKLTQGVGGPRGFGAIIDAGGNDLYRAQGPHFPSVYGTPGVSVTMGQGFGYGIRGYAAGGFGAIYDLGGDDRYEGGEFSQAGGYFFGMGIIHDASGRDLYYGNRYSQAFSAHQAIGLLIDDAGDDAYWGMTAATQAGAWDQSISILIDRGGDDTYRADGLAQGSAAQQALAVLIDLGGRDSYSGAGTSVQGHGGGNEYHAASGVYSFSALVDLGDGPDVFSSGRSAPGPTATEAPHGMFVKAP